MLRSLSMDTIHAKIIIKKNNNTVNDINLQKIDVAFADEHEKLIILGEIYSKEVKHLQIKYAVELDKLNAAYVDTIGKIKAERKKEIDKLKILINNN